MNKSDLVKQILSKNNKYKVSEIEKSFISKFRTTLKSQDFENIIIFIDENIRFLDRNANPKILFLDLSIKISDLFKKVKS